jgi:formate dehydrogenase maturation protein FdhE
MLTALPHMSVVSLPSYRHADLCPQCEGEGQAVSVGIGQNLRMLKYICSTCSHEWFISQEMPRGRVLLFRSAPSNI